MPNFGYNYELQIQNKSVRKYGLNRIRIVNRIVKRIRGHVQAIFVIGHCDILIRNLQQLQWIKNHLNNENWKIAYGRVPIQRHGTG